MKRLIAPFILLLAADLSAEPEKSKGPKGEKGRKNEFTNQLFKRLDSDENGKISLSEFESNPRLERTTTEQRAKLFQRLDKNNDGFIDRSEMRPPKPRGRGERPAWLQNGPVTFEQFSSQPRVQRLSEEKRRKLFDRLDQNGDGKLSIEDSPRGRSGPERPPKRPGQTNLDTDKDGKISFAEFQKAPWNQKLSEDDAEDRFEKIDLNGDGFLSPEERRNSRPERPRKPNKRK